MLGRNPILILQLFRKRIQVPRLQILVFHGDQFLGSGQQILFYQALKPIFRAIVIFIPGDGHTIRLAHDASIAGQSELLPFDGSIHPRHGQGIGHLRSPQKVLGADIESGFQFVLNVGGFGEGGLDSFEFKGYLKLAEFGSVCFRGWLLLLLFIGGVAIVCGQVYESSAPARKQRVEMSLFMFVGQKRKGGRRY